MEVEDSLPTKTLRNQNVDMGTGGEIAGDRSNEKAC